jgi:phosphoribosylanthranilate isomerase
VPGQHGGTGRTAPWELLASFRPGVPVILAGGLTPENVAEAVRVVRPYGVDVASGVESSPGQKDPEKVRRFIANAREAAARL